MSAALGLPISLPVGPCVWPLHPILSFCSLELSSNTLTLMGGGGTKPCPCLLGWMGCSSSIAILGILVIPLFLGFCSFLLFLGSLRSWLLLVLPYCSSHCCLTVPVLVDSPVTLGYAVHASPGIAQHLL